MRSFTFFSYYVCEMWPLFYTDSLSRFGLAAFQVLNSHRSLLDWDYKSRGNLLFTSFPTVAIK